MESYRCGYKTSTELFTFSISDSSRSRHKCDMDRSNWVSAFLMLWLLICVGSSPVSMVVHTSSKVGLPAVLPCEASQLDFAHMPHIEWQTIRESVFERMGDDTFQGEAYIDRADVPEEMLMRGNCSLFLRDVRFSDAGIYKSYLVVGESSVKNRIFLQSVQLAVIDHKTEKFVRLGADLILDLYTSQAEQVIFQSDNDDGWVVLWDRSAYKSKKGFPKDNRMIFKKVTASSAGMYKVLDSQGLALSTVKVTVTEPVLAKESDAQKIHSALGKATMSMPSLSLITLLLSIHLMFFK